VSESKKSWKELDRGAVSTRSTMEYKTGDWGVSIPKIDYEKCTKCTLCHFYCPEGAINMRKDEYPEVDVDYCKGCGICVKECPVSCMEMILK
jgi:pyruvate ferredoxin oxidoreductase delta subunit